MQGFVGGPEESDRSVDGISDDTQQAGILKHREMGGHEAEGRPGVGVGCGPLCACPMTQPETRGPSHSSHLLPPLSKKT